ncbi:hypothetical protein A2U01_0026605, partial [Trifolium medium]|nr:hypothetical protein [Trifolium medium]
MSASRVPGLMHALEGWSEHECGSTISHITKRATQMTSQPYVYAIYMKAMVALRQLTTFFAIGNIMKTDSTVDQCLRIR